MLKPYFHTVPSSDIEYTQSIVSSGLITVNKRVIN